MLSEEISSAGTGFDNVQVLKCRLVALQKGALFPYFRSNTE